MKLTKQIPKLIGTSIVFACSLGVALTFLAVRANSQVSVRATLTGTVYDQTGAVIPDCQVVAEDVATSVQYKATTNQQGGYELLNLPPAMYNLSARARGFKTAVLRSVTLTVNQSSTQNFTLAVGTQTQMVTVSGAPPLLQTGTASLGTIINTQKIEDLPLNGRHFEQLIHLTPGASPIDVSQGGGTSLNGQPSRASLFYVDGISDNAPLFSTVQVEPSIDVIQEFDVESHNDTASVGMTTGGVVNLTTKAGTDQLHGDVYEFNRNKAVSARNFFQPTPTPNFNQNQYGFTLGGPLPKQKGKTWFFGGYEGSRFVQGSSNLSRVPTSQEWGGDFSTFLGPQIGTDALGRPVYQGEIFNPFTGRATTAGQVDPLTGLVATATGYVREPFQKNTVPQSLFNPIVAWKEWIPAPNLPTIAGSYQPNYVNTQSANDTNDWMDIRLDHHISDRDAIFGRVLYNNSTSFSPNSLPTAPSVNFASAWNWGLNWTHNFDPTWLMDLRAGFQNTISESYVKQPSDFLQIYQKAGFAMPGGAFVLGAGGVKPEFPGIGITNFSSASGNSGAPDGAPSRALQFAGDVTKIAGRHTVKFGADALHFHELDIAACPSVGFDLPQTGDPSNFGTTGNGLASFLLGIPSTALQYGGYVGADLDFAAYGMYIQDSFKATSKLTINYGFRWDFTSMPTEVKNRLSAFDWDTGQFELAGSTPPPSCATTGGAAPCLPGGVLPSDVVMRGSRSLQDPEYDNAQPRLGFAYQLNKRTVVRAGAGTYFNSLADVLQNGQATRGGWPFGVLRSPAPNLNQTAVTVYAQNVLPQVETPDATPFPAGSRVNSTKIKDSYTTSWNLDVQRLLTNSLTLSGAYVGSKGSRTPFGFVMNTALTPGPGPISSRVPFPLLQSPVFGTRSIGSSWYNAFQLKADQRLNHGMSYLISYTWSKSIDTGCSGYEGVEGCQVEDPYNVRGQRGISTFDVPQVLSVSYLWQLPFGVGKPFLNQNGLLSKLVANWQLNGIFSASSGAPVTALEGDLANTGNPFERPDQVGNPIPTDRSPMNYWNVNAFALSPDCRVVPASQCRFGTLGRNTLRGPSITNWDFSVFREFPISERWGRLQFRGEFFNLFNQTNYQTTGFPGFGDSITSGTFGELLSTYPARQIQFGLKYIF